MFQTTSAKSLVREKHLSGGVLATDEKLLIIGFALFINASSIMSAFGWVLGPLGLPISEQLTIAVVYVPVVIALFERLRRGARLGVAGFVAAIALLGLLFAWSFAAHPEYASVMFDATWPFNIQRRVFGPLSAVWSLVFILMLRRADLILTAIRWAAYVVFVFGVFRFLAFTRQGYWTTTSAAGEEIQSDYSLEFGYDMIVPVVVFMLLAFRGQRRWLHAILSLAGFGLILIGGNRAPAVFVLVALAVFFVLFTANRVRQSPMAFVGLMAFVVIVGFVIVNLDSVVLFVAQAVKSFGISSRSIDAVLHGTFGDDNGRDAIYLLADRLISEGGPFGYGMYGDRYHLVANYWWGYPHSIILELQITFGVVAGILILVALATLLIVAFFISRSFEHKLLIVLGCILCLQLFVSLSYLYNPWFWCLLATCLLAIGTRRSSSGASRIGVISDERA